MAMNAQKRKEAKETFLACLRLDANVSLACDKAEISRQGAYLWREKDPEFARAWDDAVERSNDVIRRAIFQRAVEGWEEPLVSMGKALVDEDGKPLTIRKYSDSLLQFLAKSRMLEFRDKQQVEMSGSVDLTGARDTLLAKLSGLPSPDQEEETEPTNS